MMLPLCTSVTLLRLLAMAYSIADADQPLGPLARDRLDADRRRSRGSGSSGTSLGKLSLRKRDELLGVVGAGLELDPRVDVLGVLAEDHHVDRSRAA